MSLDHISSNTKVIYDMRYDVILTNVSYIMTKVFIVINDLNRAVHISQVVSHRGGLISQVVSCREWSYKPGGLS